MSLITPNLTAVQIAVLVAEHGSFVAGARALGLSASAASKAVSRLEDELGAKLFQRTTRNVSLTPAGQRFVRGAGPLLAEFRALLEDVTGEVGTVRGPLRISAPETFGRRVLAPLLPQFLARHEEVDVELQLADRFVDLAAEPFELAVRSGPLAGSARLVARPLLRDPLIVIAGSDYAAASAPVAVLDDLTAHRAVVFRNARTGREEPWRFSGGVTRRMPGDTIASDMEAVLELVVGGAGLAQVPRYLARAALADGRVVELLAGLRPEAVTYSALYMDRRHVAPSIRAFIDYVSGLCGVGA